MSFKHSHTPESFMQLAPADRAGQLAAALREMSEASRTPLRFSSWSLAMFLIEDQLLYEEDEADTRIDRAVGRALRMIGHDDPRLHGGTLAQQPNRRGFVFTSKANAEHEAHAEQERQARRHLHGAAADLLNACRIAVEALDVKCPRCGEDACRVSTILRTAIYDAVHGRGGEPVDETDPMTQEDHGKVRANIKSAGVIRQRGTRWPTADSVVDDG